MNSDKRKSIKENPQKRRRYRHGRRNRRKVRRRVFTVCAIMVMAVVIGSIAVVALFLKSGKNKTDDGEEIKNGSQEKTGLSARKTETEAIITLKEGKVTLKLGEEYLEPGYEAKDKNGTDLTGQVTVNTDALKRAGTQKVIYTVKDKNGKEASVEREVEVLPNTEYDTAGLPICMYHYVYDPDSPPENVDSNFITTDALAEEMRYLHENDYYFPSWQEVRDYVDGRLLLPEKSIVITFDDGPNFMNLGITILEEYQTPATSFVIASYWDSKEMLYEYASDYLTFESHSYKMHQGGGNIGHGGIYTAMSREEVLDDLEKSFEICGNKNAFAYPFGDYTEEGCSTLEEAGILCAVTTENAKCFPGDNPMLLPRVRMLGTQSLESFVSAIE